MSKPSYAEVVRQRTTSARSENSEKPVEEGGAEAMKDNYGILPAKISLPPRASAERAAQMQVSTGASSAGEPHRGSSGSLNILNSTTNQLIEIKLKNWKKEKKNKIFACEIAIKVAAKPVHRPGEPSEASNANADKEDSIETEQKEVDTGYQTPVEKLLGLVDRAGAGQDRQDSTNADSSKQPLATSFWVENEDTLKQVQDEGSDKEHTQSDSQEQSTSTTGDLPKQVHIHGEVLTNR